MSKATLTSEDHPFPRAGGGMAARIASFDWARTSLGAITDWPPHLKATLGLVLGMGRPALLFWGAAGRMFPNDALVAHVGGAACEWLGREHPSIWSEPEAADVPVERLVPAGEARLSTQRLNQASFLLSPVPDETGTVSGLLAVATTGDVSASASTLLDDRHQVLQRMFEQAPGYMAMLRGPDHVLTFVNRAYATLIGGRDVVDKPIRAALPEGEGQGFFEMLDRLYASGEAWWGLSQPIRLQRQPGLPPERLFIDFVCQPVRGSDGKVMGIFVQGADVTARVMAERELRRSAARHRQILDGAIDYAIIALDLEGRVTSWNAGAQRLLGWSEAEMLGQDLSRLAPMENGEPCYPVKELEQSLATGIASVERWLVRKSGERLYATGETRPIRGETNEPIGFVKVLGDHTEEYRAQQALKKSEDQLRRAQEAGGVGIFTIDIVQGRLSGSAEFCRIFGLPACDAMPAAEIERMVIDEDAHLISHDDTRRSGQAILDVEYRIRRADTGELRIIARTGEYERDESGDPVRLVGVVQDVTERRRVQRALEESEAQFRTFAESMPIQIWTAPPGLFIDWCNSEVLRYTGFGPDVLESEGWARIIHPEDLPASSALWSDVHASGDAFETEIRLRRADGNYRWHLIRAISVRGFDGTITRWIGTNIDIHEQKQAETANARDRDRMWAMSRDLLLVSDLSGVITAINPSATRLLGWEAEEMVGHPLLDFVHAADRDATRAHWSAAGTTGARASFETRLRNRDGDCRLVDWSTVVDGDRIHGVGRDITESRSIARDQERIWTLSPVLKIVATLDGSLLKINPAWSSVLGWTGAESAGLLFSDFVVETDRDRALATLAELRDGEHHRDDEFAMRSRTDRQRRVAWSFVAEGGSLYGFGRDVTEQRSTEEALRQSQKMEAVGQLTGGIAHDFNNLLQGVVGNLELMQHRLEQGRNDGLDRFIRGASGAAQRASALTHRLLAFSRRQPLDPRPVDANQLIVSMEDMLRRTLGETVILDLKLTLPLWSTRCDPNQLENAILNLAINARDAMPRGGRLVIETGTVQASSLAAEGVGDAQAGDYVRIAVKDSGMGMTPETAARAFEPFFTTKPIGQGTGLGLSMIYGFARQSEGHAFISSELGVGTAVTICLPRYLGDLPMIDGVTALSDDRVPAAGETVLVVEDEPAVRDLVVEVLGELGYVAIEANDGLSGVDILRSDARIDLLITDIGLPGLNGRQVADAGRKWRPGLKVLFMTGYAQMAAQAAGFLEPGMAMMTKPFSMEALAARIRDIINAN